jgi:hypothetical protein
VRAARLPSKNCVQGSGGSPISDSKDPFLFLTTPIKVTDKRTDSGGGPAVSSAVEEGGTPDLSPVKPGSVNIPKQTPDSKAKQNKGKWAKVPGLQSAVPMKIRNPDKVTFNRVRPHKPSSCNN